MSKTSPEIVYPAGTQGSRTRLTGHPVMVPLSWLYKLGGTIARASHPAPPPPAMSVISIGNIEVGGNGKTPLAMYVIERWESEGRSAAFVSRAFGSRTDSRDVVTVVPPVGFDGPFAAHANTRIIRRDAPGLVDEIGDEAAMVADRLPGAPLVLGRDKNRSVDVARAWFRPDAIVLDDAFQSWGVPRDLDVVLLDAHSPVGNGRLLPAGTLRESPSALKRAQLVCLNGADSAESVGDIPETLRPFLTPGTPVVGLQRDVTVVDPFDGSVVGVTDRLAAVSGIARPDGFERSLAAVGVPVAASFRFPDHHGYEPSDVSFIRRGMKERGLERMVTTEKDWVKLRAMNLEGLRPLVARLDLSLIGPDRSTRLLHPQ